MISGVNKAIFCVWHESGDCKCTLDKSAGNSKQKWNHDESRSVKNEIIGILVKMILCGILAPALVDLIRHVKLTNIQILKIVDAKNVIAC